MLKLLLSSCLQGKFQNLNSTIQPALRHGCTESSTPLLKLLSSVTGLTRKTPKFYLRATFFCSDSTDRRIEVEVKALNESEVEEADSNASSSIGPSNPKPEDYLTELGFETDDKTALSAKFRERIEPNKENIPAHVLQVIDEEIRRRSFTSSSNPISPTSSTADPFDIFTFSELINNQHWSKFKTLIKDTNPNTILQKLFDYDADSDVILRYFKWSEKEFRVCYNLEFSCRLLHLLLNSKKYRKIRVFLNGFVKNGIHSNASIFHMLSLCSDQIGANSIIVDMLVLAYAENSRTDLAFEAFERAGDYGFRLSVLSCNPMLSALVQEGKIGIVELVYKEMIRRRIRLDVITFNIVINGLCKIGKLQRAEDVLEDMKEMGVSPSVITYNILIYGYCKSSRVGKLYKADAFLKEMESNKICPNEVTYNILIDGFCKDDSVMVAMKIFKEMQMKKNLKPDVVTYNSLINGLCNEGKIEEALSLKDEMLGMDLKPDVVTYNVLINGLSKKKMLKEARELFDDIVKQGSILNPCVITFNTLIDGYCKAGKMGEATALRSLMLDRGVLPNVSTYNCLIMGFSREKNKEAVDELLSEMKEKGLKSNVVTYNILIGALCKGGESRKGIRLLDKMIEMGLFPSHITYNTLMDGYCMEGNIRAALNLRTRMEKAGKRANVVTYNVLIKGLCKKGKLEDANSLLNEMLEKGLIPNRITYEIVREEMMEKGFHPDIEGHLYSVSGSS